MAVKNKLVAQNPLILRCHRLMEAFAKSDDERDFYLDRFEGFLVYVDLDKSQEELDELEKELKTNSDRYCMIPKLTFYEVKKVMEGFVNEKVYDIDTKEKLLDIIQSKEARENFLEFIYDHHTELEKWQQYYQERFRVRIIEWLRNNQFDFVFEEDLEMTKSLCEKLKLNLFVPKVQKDLVTQRKNLVAKAKTYYSSEALNPRPKRGRPPKQVAKVETEPQFSQDIYTTIPKMIKSFLFSPDYHGSAAIFTFSGKFASEEDLLAHRKQQLTGAVNLDMQNLNQKLAALRTLSSNWNLDGKLGGQPEALEEPLEVEVEEDEESYKKSSPKAKKLDGKKVKEVKKTKPLPPVKANKFISKPVSKLAAKPAAKPASKPVPKKVPVAVKKSPPKKEQAVKSQKMRLRPLSKKTTPAPKAKIVPTKATAPVKAKAQPLRKLRPRKKR